GRMTNTFRIAAVIVLICSTLCAQSPPPCGTGEPKCYTDMTPYNGHGAASNLPTQLCSNCSGDQRRVIVVRIDSSWGSTTNANIWNAVGCAVSAWNNATDQYGNKTGYFLVVDQQNLTQVATADITIHQNPNMTGFAQNDGNVNPGSGTRTNTID